MHNVYSKCKVCDLCFVGLWEVSTCPMCLKRQHQSVRWRLGIEFDCVWHRSVDTWFVYSGLYSDGGKHEEGLHGDMEQVSHDQGCVWSPGTVAANTLDWKENIFACDQIIQLPKSFETWMHDTTVSAQCFICVDSPSMCSYYFVMCNFHRITVFICGFLLKVAPRMV